MPPAHSAGVGASGLQVAVLLLTLRGDGGASLPHLHTPPHRPRARQQPLRGEHLQGERPWLCSNNRPSAPWKEQGLGTAHFNGAEGGSLFRESFLLHSAFSCLAHFQLVSLNERNNVLLGVEESGHGSHVGCAVSAL